MSTFYWQVQQDRYVQNLREWSGNSLVSGRGINPVTNIEIKDENVGHIDINGFYCFPYENQTIEFPTVGYTFKNRWLLNADITIFKW